MFDYPEGPELSENDYSNEHLSTHSPDSFRRIDALIDKALKMNLPLGIIINQSVDQSIS